jgi:MFS superfamily sulfate permease-like transporter
MAGFALFSRTRHLIVGPEAALAALSAITLGGLAHGDAARALALSGALALIIGLLLLAAGDRRRRRTGGEVGWCASARAGGG